MLKSSVQTFKHDCTIMWDKHNCPTVWTFFTTTLLGNLDESESESHSVVSDSWQPHGLYRPWNSPGQNTGVGSCSLLQGIFPNQRLNPGLLHCRQILYQLSHSSVQWFSRVRLFATQWTAARQASLSVTNSWSLLKLMSIKLVMPSNQLILCHSLLLLPSIFPSIRVFSNESVLHIRWPKYWSFKFSMSFQWIFRTDFL